MISVITRTYNRAQTICRAVESVLNQDYRDLELIIVDDGSNDNTLEILSEYSDPRIRIIKHAVNKGMAAAFHTGLDNIKGEWFTLLDSDDEMKPYALSTLLQIPREIDCCINAITCNCIDSSTGEFSGKGLSADQYLDAVTILQKCRGEFWGLTKTELLPIRNSELYLASVWNKINKVATRYYIHKGLRIYHTESNDRYSVHDTKPSDQSTLRRYQTYLSILSDKELLSDYKKWGPDFYCALHYTMGKFFLDNDYKELARHCLKEVRSTKCDIRKLTLLYARQLLGGKIFNLLRPKG